MVTVGVILSDLQFRRPPGDVGNAESYPCRVIFEVARGVTAREMVSPTPNTALLAPYLECALKLQEQGADVVATTCGFLIGLQDAIAKQLRVPFVASSLLQIPLVHRLVNGRVGIITANDDALTMAHLKLAGVSDDVPIAVRGMQHHREFADPLLNGVGQMDLGKMEVCVADAARELLDRHPDIKAFVCECHNLPPFGQAIQRKTGAPVFDILSLVGFARQAFDKVAFARG
jgi:maleate cis-trans isomerase